MERNCWTKPRHQGYWSLSKRQVELAKSPPCVLEIGGGPTTQIDWPGAHFTVLDLWPLTTVEGLRQRILIGDAQSIVMNDGTFEVADFEAFANKSVARTRHCFGRRTHLPMTA